MSNQAIALQLATREQTVRDHIHKLLRKLRLEGSPIFSPRAKQSPLSPQLDRVRKICTNLRQSLEGLSNGEPAFFVDNKIYALFSDYHHQDRRIAVWVPMPFGTQEMLIERAAHKFFQPPTMTMNGWLGIDLEQVDDEELRHYLHQAWQLVAAKRF